MIEYIIYILSFIIIMIILYYIYYTYFIQNLNYSSYINLDDMKPINTTYKPLNTAIILTGSRISNNATILSQKYFIYNLLKPDIYTVDLPELRDFFKEYKNVTYFKPSENYQLAEYETIYELNKIINKQSKKYNLIIRLRTDLYVKEPLHADIINNIKENTIYIPSNKNSNIYYSSYIGVNDYFAISNKETFNIYANFYNYLKNNNNLSCNIVEYMLKKYLNDNKVSIYNDFNYEIVIYKLRTNQPLYLFVLITQYIKKFNEKFHCIIKDS